MTNFDKYVILYVNYVKKAKDPPLVNEDSIELHKYGAVKNGILNSYKINKIIINLIRQSSTIILQIRKKVKEFR